MLSGGWCKIESSWRICAGIAHCESMSGIEMIVIACQKAGVGRIRVGSRVRGRMGIVGMGWCCWVRGRGRIGRLISGEEVMRNLGNACL